MADLTVSGSIDSFMSLTDASAVRFVKFNADNTVSLRSDSDMRADLGLVIGTNVQAYDADLASWAGVTRASGFDTFTATPSSANLAALLTDKTGSGANVFATSPTLTTPTIAAINGGTAANDDITIQGTTNSTRTTSYALIQPNGGLVGIGTSTPTAELHLVHNTGGGAGFVIERTSATTGKYSMAVRSDGGFEFGESGVSTRFLITKTTGRVAFGGITNPGSMLSVSGNSAIGSGYATSAAPANGLMVEGNVLLGTSTDAGTGKLQVTGNAAITGNLTASGTIKNGSYTVGTLPSASTSGAGSRAYVTDANATTFASTVAAGGSNKVPVYSDGTNWLIG